MLVYIYYVFILTAMPLSVFFLVLFARTRQVIQFLTGLLWLLPVAYEPFVIATCKGECNIRIDLLLIFPLELLILSVLSIVALKSYGVHTKNSVADELL